jgi:hypothetical protein
MKESISLKVLKEIIVYSPFVLYGSKPEGLRRTFMIWV